MTPVEMPSRTVAGVRAEIPSAGDPTIFYRDDDSTRLGELKVLPGLADPGAWAFQRTTGKLTRSELLSDASFEAALMFGFSEALAADAEMSASTGVAPATRKARMRNYKAMKDQKLAACISDLERESGDAYERAVAKHGSHQGDLIVARQEARSRGLI